MTEMTAIKLNQLKKASEAYKEDRAIHTDSYDQVDPSFPAWPEYRDKFLADWTSIREIKTEKEADAMFDKLVDEAEQELEVAAAIVEGSEPAEGTTTGGVTSEPTPAPVATAPKRRGRPPGNAAKIKRVKAKVLKVAAKKKGGSASAKAQTIIEKYAARDWSRKDILEKLQAQLGMGAAYAATLYQKFA